jgi:aspartyl-tRNA(Asn)/glutamyl-tRNA(Gln) amidotransferase subunit A
VSADPADLAFLSARQIAALVRERKVSPVEITRVYLERIERLDSRLRAYITVVPDKALETARAAETAVMCGQPLGPLHGVPYAVKDQFDTAGVRTTSGSRILEDHVPIEDATTISRLNSAGGILLGKLNLTEFALGGTQQFPFGQPRNPWNLDHDPGGSSSGSGIAVAAGLCAASLGEDTGGSVRSPASFCGVVGLRPTWSRVSRHGSFPLSWSMDTPGPLARTVEDVAWLLQAIAGYDAKDPLSSRAPVPEYAGPLADGVRGLRVGIVRELTFGPDTDAEVREAVLEAVRCLERLGAVTEEISLRLVPFAGAIFMALADADGAGVHHRWLRSRPGDYDQGTRRRLLTASLIPAAIQQRAARARALLRAEMREALARLDLLLCPTAHQAAPPIAAARGAITGRQEVAGRFFTRRSYVTPAALAGLPAIAVPCGFTRSGLPISLQLIGRHFDEATVLRAAHAYEQQSEWSRRRPPGTS